MDVVGKTGGRGLFHAAHMAELGKVEVEATNDMLRKEEETETASIESSRLQQLKRSYSDADPTKRGNAERLLQNFDFSALCSALVAKYKALPAEWLEKPSPNGAPLTLPDLLFDPTLASTIEQLPASLQSALTAVKYSGSFNGAVSQNSGRVLKSSVAPLLGALGITCLGKTTITKFNLDPVAGAELYHANKIIILQNTAGGRAMENSFELLKHVLGLKSAADPGSRENIRDKQKQHINEKYDSKEQQVRKAKTTRRRNGTSNWPQINTTHTNEAERAEERKVQ
jgi:hypothetical protein